MEFAFWEKHSIDLDKPMNEDDESDNSYKPLARYALSVKGKNELMNTKLYIQMVLCGLASAYLHFNYDATRKVS